LVFVTEGTDVIGEKVRITSTGNVGIGTTSPLQKLHVAGECVVGNTLLPIKRRRKKKNGEDDDEEYEDLLVPIKDIQAGDLVASLDEQSGEIVYREIRKLLNKGFQKVIKITTVDGRSIETTLNHPYLTISRGSSKISQTREVLTQPNREIEKAKWVKVSELKAGMKIAERAGKNIKKCVLELGGSDPFIVLDDVDVKQCAAFASQGRVVNSGQSCIAAKRFIVHEKIRKEFEKNFAEHMKSLKVGNPLDEKTQVGPLARHDLLDALLGQVDKSVKMGAEIAVGGNQEGKKGYFMKPTVITDVKPGMPVFAEETFGPVACVIGFKNEDEAVKLANMTEYGLGASVWSRDVAKAERLAARIDAGAVFVNKVVASDPRIPFGGIKKSGYGRELGRAGILEFVNAKSVVIQ